MGRKRKVIGLWLTGLLLAGCDSGERDRIADRIEPGIAPAHTTDPDERREIAESLADDVISLREDAQQIENSQAEAARVIEAQHGTVADVVARDCETMRLELQALERPSIEIRTAEEIAAIPGAIEALKTRLQQNCS